MKEYIAQPNYEHELTELTEPGKLCGPTGVFVKKGDCDAALAKAREEGRREVEARFWPIFLWLLGYTDWPERKQGEGAFYWRTKLRRDLEDAIEDFAALLEKEDGK